MTDAADEADLHCPLCGYSLRGLVDPRCPECGFAFAWAELREAARNRHPYLFEHGAGHNLRTFWLTFWRDCRPRKFWRELSPAHPIRLRRLAAYWAISNFAMGLLIPVIWVRPTLGLATLNTSQRAALLAPPTAPFFMQSGWTVADVDHYYPKPWTARFVREVYDSPIPWREPAALVSLLAVWDGLTLLTLMIFQASLRRKQIRAVHLVRCMMYSCDFPVLFAGTFFLTVYRTLNNDWQTVIVLCVCLCVITYRLYFAVKRYLRFDHALAMVLASQIIVAMSVLAILFNVEGPWYH